MSQDYIPCSTFTGVAAGSSDTGKALPDHARRSEENHFHLTVSYFS
jgi:hypothetical protein